MKRFFLLFLSMSFIITFSTFHLFADSKYRNTKQKKGLKEKQRHIYVYPGQGSVSKDKEGQNAVPQADKKYQIGIVFHPKNHEKVEKYENIIFSNIADSFYNKKEIKILNRKEILEELKELDISVKLLVLNPTIILGTPMETNAVIIVIYQHNQIVKEIKVELRYADIEGGKLYKMEEHIFFEDSFESKFKSLSDSLVSKVQSVINQNKQEMAIDYNKDALEYFELGKKYAVGKLYRQAQKEFEKALKLDPSMTKAYLELATVTFIATNSRDKQLSVLEEGVKQNPNDFELRLELGKTYNITGKKSDAKDQFNYIIVMDKDPDSRFKPLALQFIQMISY